MAAPLINGIAYDFTQIVFLIDGVPMPSITSLNYEEVQEKENNFGSGTRPVSRGKGPIDATASFELSMNDVEALRSVAPSRSLLLIAPFDIIVVFGNIQNPVTHTIKDFEFTNDPTEGNSGDKDIKSSLEGIASQILR